MYEVPLTRSQLHENQQVEEQLELYEKEIREARLVIITCVIPDASADKGSRECSRYALLPSRGMVITNDIISINKTSAAALPEKVFLFDSVIKNPQSLTFYRPSDQKGGGV